MLETPTISFILTLGLPRGFSGWRWSLYIFLIFLSRCIFVILHTPKIQIITSIELPFFISPYIYSYHLAFQPLLCQWNRWDKHCVSVFKTQHALLSGHLYFYQRLRWWLFTLHLTEQTSPLITGHYSEVGWHGIRKKMFCVTNPSRSLSISKQHSLIR